MLVQIQINQRLKKLISQIVKEVRQELWANLGIH